MCSLVGSFTILFASSGIGTMRTRVLATVQLALCALNGALLVVSC